MYYEKKVDILVTKGMRDLGIVSIKFVSSNYKQNSVNYFEQQVGEIANLRQKKIVYGNLFFVTNPIIYYNKDHSQIDHLEKISDHDIGRYVCLLADNDHPHAPDEMAIGIVDLDTDSSQITDISDPAALEVSRGSRASLSNQLNVEQFFSRMARRIELRYRSP